MILALAGNPNCGKTTLFNALTGANARTGNFPGVTVTRSEGVCRARPEITFVDLPGVYALRPYSDEERVTRSYLLGGAAAVVLDGNLTAETITWLGAHCSAPLFADPVSVTKAERMRASLGALHTFKPNLTEGQNLTGESTPEGIVAALLAQGVQRVFLSMGADGILAGTCGELVHLPCLPTCMVNTTGGGDAVMAALVWAYLHGLGLRESAAAALRAGKATVEYPGTNNPDLGALVHG